MKTINSKMVKFADKSNYIVQSIIENVNKSRFDNWDFNPAIILSTDYSNALKSIIYSILKVENHYSAKDSINRIASIFGTCPQYAERMIRGIDKIQLQTRFGSDNIIIK